MKENNNYKKMFIGVTMVAFLTFAGIGIFFSQVINSFMLVSVLLIGAAIMSIIAVTVYRDSKQLGLNSWKWALIAVYVPSGLGVILYIIHRNAYIQKIECKDLI